MWDDLNMTSHDLIIMLSCLHYSEGIVSYCIIMCMYALVSLSNVSVHGSYQVICIL